VFYGLISTRVALKGLTCNLNMPAEFIFWSQKRKKVSKIFRFDTGRHGWGRKNGC